MTGLALIPDDRAVVQRIESVQEAAVRQLGEWAASADAAYRVAQRLVESAFVPQQFRGKPIEATAAILSGIEVGLSPMSALRAFDIIQGAAAPKAITLRAVVQSHGHEMVLVESTETRCRMRGRRRGSGEWQSVTWTIDRARALGLVGKDNWKKQPGAMLVARATSELARLVASDAILGIGYSSEELADGGGYDEPSTVTPEPTRTGTQRVSRRRAAQEAPLPEPPLDEPAQTPAPDPQADTDMVTEPQMRKLQAHYKDADRADRLAEAEFVLGRPVDSFSTLTKDEASRLIDAIEEATTTP